MRSNTREDDTMADHALRRCLAPPRHAVNHSARPSRRTYADNVQTFIVTRGGGIRKTAATAIIMIMMLIILWNFRRLTINTQYTTPRNSDLNDSAVICSIVSNEEFYLDEWIDYNLGIGFAKIYIYDNTKHFDLGHGWLDRRGARLADRVSIQHYPGEGKQGTAYSDCARQALLDRHRWAFCTDVDEFLVLKKHPDVTSFLMEHDINRAALSINWQIHSWDNQMQFRPLPVTKRFVGKVRSGANIHVKTISNVDKMDLDASHHPHFPTLKGNHFSIDTNGDKVDVKWSNERYPSDVALIYHFICKSWKEYIGKRSRGRAGTLTGKNRTDSVAALIADAQKGKGLSNTTEIDSSTWEALKERNPKYQFFDAVDSTNEENQENAWRSSIGGCCYAKDQEAYVDEWVDYHIALGFSRLYVYDGSDEFWMRQWNEQRNETRLSLLHFPATGNHTNLDEKAKAYANCVGQHGNDHHAIVFLDVNDFVVLPESAGNDPITPLLDRSAHAFQFERVLFGHNSQVWITRKIHFQRQHAVFSLSHQTASDFFFLAQYIV